MIGVELLELLERTAVLIERFKLFRKHVTRFDKGLWYRGSGFANEHDHRSATRKSGDYEKWRWAIATAQRIGGNTLLVKDNGSWLLSVATCEEA